MTHLTHHSLRSWFPLSIIDGEGRIRKYCLLLEEEKGDRGKAAGDEE